ncbi:MAG: putative sugar phosphate isomerase/epimerase [Solirubrobacterales bacterium]|nr:putative sugar phosphate isomerase/epimerase [Solirubrobacterales bacterium]
MGRFRYAYNALVYHGEDIADSIERVARFGYDAIEIVGEPGQYDPRRIAKLTGDAGIAVSSICSIYTPERDLVHPDPAVRAAAVRYVEDVARFACEMSCPTIIVHPTACMKTAALADPEQEWEWAVQGIRAAGETAADLGVSLSLECWNRYETYFMNRLEQAVALWQATGLANGGVQGDTFHMNLEEESIAQAFRAAGPHLQHVHLADSNRAAPGSGHLDFGPIVQALADVGYDGYLSFELLPAFADPFAAMSAGGQEAFFDRYTEQAIAHIRACESELAEV